jgi:hypothetical protein
LFLRVELNKERKMPQRTDSHIPATIQGSLDRQIAVTLGRRPPLASALDADAVSAITADLRARWQVLHQKSPECAVRGQKR